MGREYLEWVLGLLQQGGIPAGEAWPGERRPEPEEAVAAVGPNGEGWTAAGAMEVCVGGLLLEGVISFRAVRDQGRRRRGARGRGEPVGGTSGTDGGTIELVQRTTQEPQTAEPFELTLRRGKRSERFGGCCWNETVLEYDAAGGRMIRRGFALTREVLENG